MTADPTGRPVAAAHGDLSEGRVDVAVIGAGQAGLAIGHLLAARELSVVILEAGDAVGSAWSRRRPRPRGRPPP